MNEKTWTVFWTGHLRDACCHTRFGRNSGRTAECNILDDGDYDDDDNVDDGDGDQSTNEGDDEDEDEAIVQNKQ